MDDEFSHYPGQILREDCLGVFTQSPFLSVHFHWTTTKRDYGSRTEAHFERGGRATEPYRRRASPRPY